MTPVTVFAFALLSLVDCFRALRTYDFDSQNATLASGDAGDHVEDADIEDEDLASEGAEGKSQCSDAVVEQLKALHIHVANLKTNGRAYVYCSNDATVSQKISCSKQLCQGADWCFIPNNCGKIWNRCAKLDMDMRCQACSAYKNREECDLGVPKYKDVGQLQAMCQWDGTSCQEACFQFTTDATCTANAHCKWFGSACIGSGDVHKEVRAMNNFQGKVKDSITVFSHDKLLEVMKPNKNFPAELPHLQYMIWMDQRGWYSNRGTSGAADDGLVVFAQVGENDHTINEEGWMRLGTCNTGWAWFDTPKGRHEYDYCRSKGYNCHYDFHWQDPRRTEAIIYNFAGKQWLTPKVESWLMEFTLTMMPWWKCELFGKCSVELSDGKKGQNDCKAAGGRFEGEPACDEVEANRHECPPPEGSKNWNHECALYRRDSNLLGLTPDPYYAFAIADENGKPIEPYWTAFLESMAKNKIKGQLVGNHDREED